MAKVLLQLVASGNGFKEHALCQVKNVCCINVENVGVKDAAAIYEV